MVVGFKDRQHSLSFRSLWCPVPHLGIDHPMPFSIENEEGTPNTLFCLAV